MKRILLLALLWLCWLSPTQAQNIVAAEYYFDNDPGFGNGIPYPAVTPATEVEFTTNPDISGLSNGFHTLYSRGKDSNGVWSAPQAFTFVKVTLLSSLPGVPNIVTGEYYFDNDPGFGNGISYPVATPAIEVDFIANPNISGLSYGLHILYSRGKDANGLWSAPQAFSFVKVIPLSSPPNIVAAEYYIDVDPGFGNANGFPAEPPAVEVEFVTTVDITSFPAGSHILYGRGKDANGKWSMPQSQVVVFIPQPPSILSFTPTSGPIGITVTITGTNFDLVPANNAVNFNGTIAATPTGVTATNLTVVVPAGATTGPISVTTPNGTVTSSIDFTVTTSPIPFSGLKLWLKADDLVLTDNSPVTVWSDASGLGQDFSGTGATRPTFKTNGCLAVLNGKPYIQYTFQFLKRDDVIGLPPNTPRTIIAIYRMDNPAQREFTVEQGDFTTVSTFFGLDANTFGTQGNRFGVYATNNTYDANLATDRNYHIHFLTANTMAIGTNVISDVEYLIDNNLITLTPRVLSAGGNYVSFASANEMRIQGGNVDMAEVIVYDRPLSGTERSDIVTYLQNKYGSFPIAPPAPAPTITSFSPGTGSIGSAITITGTNFTGTSDVNFNGTPATTFTVVSPTSITATVPTGVTIGPINVTVGCNTVTSATNFIVSNAPPTITLFSPTSGPISTTVIITGTNFDTTPANNIVKFNGVDAATPSAASATSLTVTVPTGTTSGPISVTSINGTALSSLPFIVNSSYIPFGNTVELDGSLDRIEVVDNAALRPTSLTLEAWLKVSTTQSYGVVAGKPVGSATQNSYAIWFESGKFAGGVNPLGLATGLTFDWTPTIGQWYHVAMTYDNTTQTQVLYLNGAVVASGTKSTPVFDGKPFLIGIDINSGSFGGHFPGYLDEVRLWNVARTQSDIQSTMNITLNGNESGLAAYYKMDENGQGAGITVANSSTATGATLNGTTFGTACTPIFTINAPPTLSSFTPTSGVIGTSVTINGTNFSTTPANNIVTFNGTAAIVTASTTTSITTTVPVGTTSGTVSITLCGQTAASSSNFTICSPPSPPSVTNGSGCANSSVELSASGAIGTQEYRWYDVPSGGTSLSSTANFTTPTLTATTNYYVSIFDPAGSCESARTMVTATINAAPAKPIIAQIGSLNFCSGGNVTLDAPVGFSSYQWSDGDANPSRIVSTSLTLTLKVTNASGCQSIESDPITTVVFALPAKPIITGATSFCTGGSLLLSAPLSASYLWSDGDTNQTRAISTAVTLTVKVTDSNGCESVDSDPVSTTEVSIPTQPGVTNNSGCSGTSTILNASGGSAGDYRWYSVSTAGTALSGFTNDTFTAPSLSSTTSYFVAITNGTCESTRTEVIATVLPLPAAPSVTIPSSVCSGSSVTLNASGTANGNYRWYDGGTLITGEVNNSYVVTNLTTNKTYQAAIFDGTCESTKTSVTATIKNCTAPTIASTTASAFIESAVTIDLRTLISDSENDLDESSLQIVGTLTSGASFTLNGFLLTINYSGVPFPGTDKIIISICDQTGLCTQQELSIELSGTITVYNAVSPNGDNKNETLYIQYIGILPETKSNKVTIYNRWGDEMWKTDDYDNVNQVFKGISSAGNELPSGTYYYKIFFNANGKSKTGFISLKK